MNAFERAVEYAEYLLEVAKQNPTKLLSSPLSASSKGKSIHQKLLELYIEECGRQPEDKMTNNKEYISFNELVLRILRPQYRSPDLSRPGKNFCESVLTYCTRDLVCATHLLPKLVRRDKLNCLILKLYPGNEGYSLMLRSKTGIETETFKLPYEVTELLDYIDDSELPPFLVDILDKAQVNVFYSGCVIVEVRDYRRSASGSYDTSHVLLRPTQQSLLADINNLTSDNHNWTQDDQFQLESKILLATEEPLCLDPSPAVLLISNRLQFDRRKLNNPVLKRAVKPYTQAAINRKRKFAQSAAPAELKLHDFIIKKKDKKQNSSVNLKLSKSVVDPWKPRTVTLTPPESVDVEKYAKALDKPNVTTKNILNLVEEHTLERDVTTEKKLLARLTIFHRPNDDAYLGELYLDHDYVEEKSKGASCKFLLGNKDGVRKYLDQFKEIFTEEGRRAVKITMQRPGHPPIITCTQTVPTPVSGNLGTTAAQQVVLTKQTAVPVTATVTTQLSEPVTLANSGLTSTVGMKRNMPIQLSLSIGPTGTTLNASPNLLAPATQQGASGPTHQATSQLQLNIQPQTANQSQTMTQRVNVQQQQNSQSQSASQRLKQLGIHTNIASSRNNTPAASPVTSQPTVAQLFSSPPPASGAALTPQPTLTKTPTHTPTPTPPPPIVSPPAVPVVVPRKSGVVSESSTVHHLAQTPHHANVATFIQGGEAAQPAVTITHQQQPGVANINIANITQIPPNINIQNLTGLPGMNIANLSGLQNMQVSLSVHGGSIAVPISMISTNPLVQNPTGILVSSLTSTASGTVAPISSVQQNNTTAAGSATTTLVTMVTALPTATLTSSGTTATATTQVVTVTTAGTVLTTPTGMLSLPIGLSNITQLVPAGLKSHGQLRTSISGPVLQFANQGIQLVSLPQQRAPLKTSATVQPGQTLGQLHPATKTSTSLQAPVSTTLLSTTNLAGQQVISPLPLGKQQGGTTTIPHQQLIQLPQLQAQLQQALTKQQQQQLQFHQIQLKQPAQGQPIQSPISKPKSKKRTTPTPPKN